MRVDSRNRATILICLAGILSHGCTDATAPTGSIQVTVVTTGNTEDRDLDGYMLIVDDNPGTAVAVNAALTIPDVAIGQHVVRLDGLQSNCILAGNNPRTVDVTDGGKGRVPAPVVFIVSCGPRTGTIQVTTVTTGPEPDANGYVVIVGGVSRGNITSNGTLNVGGIGPGDWGVELGGVANNCTVDPPQFRNVTVTLGPPVPVAFSIRCIATVSLRITMATTGEDLDSNGYQFNLSVPGQNFLVSDTLKTNGTTTVSGLVPGNYVLTLSGIAPNCDAVNPGPRTVAVAADATVLRLEVTCESGRQLAFVNRLGNTANIHVINSNDAGNLPIVSDPAVDQDPAWSPDGSKIAFASNRSGDLDIYVMTLAGASVVRLTASAGLDYRPAWSPDGAKIAFVSSRDGNPEIYVMNPDGSSQVRITNSLSLDGDPDWSPDGTQIAFTSDRGGGTIGIWVMNADGSSANRLTNNTRGDWHPAWSPDGTRIAFSRGVSASSRDIWVMNADGTGVAPVTNGFSAAEDPSWSPDGRKIAFSSPSCDVYYYYYYNCDAALFVVGLDGTLFSPLTTSASASNPTWRP
jgi:Tol biopolymer transport system component